MDADKVRNNIVALIWVLLSHGLFFGLGVWFASNRSEEVIQQQQVRWIEQSRRERKEWQLEAVNAGAAKWEVNNVGDVRFAWKVPVETP